MSTRREFFQQAAGATLAAGVLATSVPAPAAVPTYPADDPFAADRCCIRPVRDGVADVGLLAQDALFGVRSDLRLVDDAPLPRTGMYMRTLACDFGSACLDVASGRPLYSWAALARRATPPGHMAAGRGFTTWTIRFGRVIAQDDVLRAFYADYSALDLGIVGRDLRLEFLGGACALARNCIITQVGTAVAAAGMTVVGDGFSPGIVVYARNITRADGTPLVAD